ncbi:MAG: hypothetical protein AAB263_10090, partial [Planctomycetota bacterium]
MPLDLIQADLTRAFETPVERARITVTDAGRVIGHETALPASETGRRARLLAVRAAELDIAAVDRARIGIVAREAGAAAFGRSDLPGAVEVWRSAAARFTEPVGNVRAELEAALLA